MSSPSSNPPSSPQTNPAPQATPPSAAKTPPTVPQRGDIYWVSIPKYQTKGTEQYKRRPWLVISNNAMLSLSLVVGVPLTSKVHKQNRQFRIMIRQADILVEAGSTLGQMDRVALTEQVRALAVERLEFPRQGRVTDTALYAIEAGVAFVLDIA